MGSYKHSTNTILLFLTPPKFNPNLFSLKYISNITIIIKGVAILMPIIMLDI